MPPETQYRPGLIPTRPYGPEAIPLSIIGFGGIVAMNGTPDEVARRVNHAVSCGVNYFDVAPAYGDAEERLGPALKPLRDRIFLACKTALRDADSARAQLRRSFELLQTDHFDLYQLHGLIDPVNDVSRAFASDGAMTPILEAKAEGRIRHLGFSAHSEDAAIAAMEHYDFDSILFPVNFAAWHQGGFGPRVLDEARKRGMSILALKAMARGLWPEDGAGRDAHPKCWYQPLTDPAEMERALRWTLSQPVTAALPPGDERLFAQALDMAQRFQPMTEDELETMRTESSKVKPIFP